jgi:hypothetical protein
MPYNNLTATIEEPPDPLPVIIRKCGCEAKDYFLRDSPARKEYVRLVEGRSCRKCRREHANAR